MKKKKTITIPPIPPIVQAYPKNYIKDFEKKLTQELEEKYKRPSHSIVFPIGKKRRQQLPQNVQSQYSDAVLEKWTPQQHLYPATINSNSLTAKSLQNKINRHLPINFFHNPHQDLDYIIYQDLYMFTMAGPIMRDLTKFTMGTRFKPKILPRFEDSGEDEIELAKKYKDVLRNLQSIDDNFGNAANGLSIPLFDRISRILLNCFTFNRSLGVYGYEEPVTVYDGQEFDTIPSSIKDVHPRDIGLVNIDNDSWNLNAVQIKQSNEFMDAENIFYLWNSMMSAPVYQSDWYGASMMANMMDECRTLRRLIGINFPTYADAMHTGIPLVVMDPENMKEADRIQIGDQFAAQWNDGSPNLIFKDPEKIVVHDLKFDPKINEFRELSETLANFAIIKGNLPISLYHGEGETNMATLRHRIQLAISVNILPIRRILERALEVQHYGRFFKTMYGDSQEYKDIKIGVEFSDLQIETLLDRIEVASEINDNYKLTPEGFGEYLQDPNFATKIDQTQMVQQQQQQKMQIKNKQTGEKFHVKHRNSGDGPQQDTTSNAAVISIVESTRR